MSIVITLLTVFLVMVSALLILVTLMQRPKQEGLGAAFGGGMMNDTFGAQTTDVLQKSTVWLTVAFFGVAILLTVLNTRYYKSQRDVGNILENVQKAEPMPGFPTPEAISKEASKTPAADTKKADSKKDSAKPAADKAPAKTDANKAAKKADAKKDTAKPTTDKAPAKTDAKAAKKDSAKPAADKAPAKTDAKAANPAKAGDDKAK